MKDEEMVSRLIGAEKFYTTELEMLRDIQKCLLSAPLWRFQSHAWRRAADLAMWKQIWKIYSFLLIMTDLAK